jgi:hypothetical protein
MRKYFLFLFLFVSVFGKTSRSQVLKPGFDKSECLTMLEIGANFGDSAYGAKFPKPAGYKMIYRSLVMESSCITFTMPIIIWRRSYRKIMDPLRHRFLDLNLIFC